MSKFLKESSKEQLTVIKSETINHSPIVIVAWAGSWKTTTIVNKMGYSIENWIVPNQMLALSFSNKSAKEITNRVEKKLWNLAIWIQSWTFHSIALKLLKANISEFKYIKILDSDDDKKYIKKIYDKYYKETISKIKADFKNGTIEEDIFMYYMSLISPLSDIQWCISRSKNTNENIFDIIFEKIVNKVESLAINRPQEYKHYSEVLFSKDEHKKFINEVAKNGKKNNMIELFYLNIKYAIQTIKEYENNKINDKYNSFDDLLINIVKFLKNNDLVRSKIDQKYKYVFVDEFQDVNYIQFEFIKLINQDYNFLIVVGDADQAIYSFRWCDSYYFSNMKHVYPQTRLFQLNDNYRSDWHIVALANTSISNNTDRYDKVMNNIKEIKHIPRFLNKEDETELFWYVANEIKNNNDYSNTVILYRNNSHSLQIQKKLIENKIPFNVVWWQNILNKKYSKDIRALISVLVSIDILSMERLITIFPKIWIKTAEKILLEIDNLKKETSVINELITPLLKIKWLKPLYNYIKDYNDWKITLNMLLEDFSKNILHTEIYKKVAPDKIEVELDNIEEIIQLILNLSLENYELSEILEMITLDNINDTKDNNKLTLSTIHRSKWLEWDNVYLIKAYKNIFPWFKSMESKFLLEEERNLFYVAITRAKSNLTICNADSFYNWFEYKSLEPSMFINEIIEYLE